MTFRKASANTRFHQRQALFVTTIEQRRGTDIEFNISFHPGFVVSRMGGNHQTVPGKMDLRTAIEIIEQAHIIRQRDR